MHFNAKKPTQGVQCENTIQHSIFPCCTSEKLYKFWQKWVKERKQKQLPKWTEIYTKMRLHTFYYI